MMKKKMDVLVNRIVYSLYCLHYYEGRIICIVVDLVFGWPFHHLPLVRKRMEKVWGVTNFKEHKNIVNDVTSRLLIAPASMGASFFLRYLSTAFFSLPFFLLLNGCILLVGQPAGHIVSKYLIVFVILCVAPSWILCEHACWKKERYLKHFAAFASESRARKITWAIGTLIAFFLLSAANFAILKFADDIHDILPKH